MRGLPLSSLQQGIHIVKAHFVRFNGNCKQKMTNQKKKNDHMNALDCEQNAVCTAPPTIYLYFI